MANDGTEILVVDDDPTQLRLYRLILEKGGYSVRTSASAKEVTRRLQDGGCPAMILSDIMMPEMDGVRFLQTLEQNDQWSQVPVVLMTAQPSVDRIQAAYAMAVPPEGFLIKPIRPATLLHTVGEVLARRNPLQALRAAQRGYLHTRLAMARELASVKRSEEGSEKAVADCRAQMLRARKEIESLRRDLTLVSRQDESRREEMRVRIHGLETACQGYRQQLESFEMERHEVMGRRLDIATRFERQLHAMEGRIQTLARQVPRGDMGIG